MNSDEAGNPSKPCHVCGKSFDVQSLRPWSLVRPSVSAAISLEHPSWGDGKYICRADLARYRRSYIQKLLEQDRGELSELDRQVLECLEQHQTLSQMPDQLLDDQSTFGERMADKVAIVGGSWKFILSFGVVLLIWMTLNVTGWLFTPFDLYPFILLNLVLSCLAAIQAPVIMMSQRRQELKDRIRNENDYKINHQMARQ